MPKRRMKTQIVKEIVAFYEDYKRLREASDLVTKRRIRPRTLDDHLEEINPYYSRGQIRHRGQVQR